MIVSLVVAAAENDVIGRNNALPWHLPADLKYFKTITMAKPIVMGRKTWESIGRPLPGRHNVVITRQPLAIPGCTVVHSLEEALQATADAAEVMVIGGAVIFASALPMARRVYLTRVHAMVDGDTFLPALDPAQWREVSRQDCSADEKNAYAYSFLVLERN